MGHDTHFLQRLSRVERNEVELALGLYRDPGLVKQLLRHEQLPESADRVALSLGHPTRGPFVVVARSGHFITCLGKDMKPYDLPVLTRTQLDDAAKRFDRARAAWRASEAPEEKRASQQLNNRVWRDGHRLSREDFASLAALQPIVGRDYLSMANYCLKSFMQELPLNAADPRPLAARSELLKMLWDGFWAVGHYAALAASGGSEPFTDNREQLANGLVLLCRFSALYGWLPVTARIIWAVSRLGGLAPGILKAAHHQSQFGSEMIQLGLGLAGMSLARPSLRRELRKAFKRDARTGELSSGRPESMREGAASFATMMLTMLDAPEEHLSEALARARSTVIDSRDDFPKSSSFHFDVEAQVSDDFAMAWALNLNLPLKNDPGLIQYLVGALPWLSTVPAEALYLSREALRGVPEFVPADGIGMVEALDFGPRQETVRRDDRIGRNERCRCGSGKKFKRCCGDASKPATMAMAA